MELSNVSLGKLNRISLSEIVKQLKSSSKNVGCIILFIGIVREEAALGGKVNHLFYEAYESMAIKKMQELINNVVNRENVFSACIHHELGKVKVGELTMIVGVAAKHRADGFKAIQWLVDKVKSEVPIWKKEVTDKGDYWVHEIKKN